MSIRRLTSRDRCTIKRLGVTQDAAGGQVRTYSAANRTAAGLKTSSKGRVQSLEHDNRIEYGVEGDEEAFIWYFHDDPQLLVEDLLEWTDKQGRSHSAPVFKPSRDADNQGRLFSAVVVEEDTNE